MSLIGGRFGVKEPPPAATTTALHLEALAAGTSTVQAPAASAVVWATATPLARKKWPTSLQMPLAR